MKEEETQLLVDHFSGLLFLMREEGDLDFFTSLVNICKHKSNIHRWLASFQFNLSSSTYHLISCLKDIMCEIQMKLLCRYCFDVTWYYSGNHVSFEEPCEQVTNERGECKNLKIFLSKVSCLTSLSQGDCGHLDCQHDPCRAHGYPLQSVCGYHFDCQHQISLLYFNLLYFTKCMWVSFWNHWKHHLSLLLGCQPWPWKLSWLLCTPSTRLVSGNKLASSVRYLIIMISNDMQ